MKFEELPYYEQLHQLVTKMRTAYWEGKKYGSRSSFQKADRYAAEVDKIVRAENLRRQKEEKHGV